VRCIMLAVQSNPIGSIQELRIKIARLSRENTNLQQENDELVRRVNQLANRLSQIKMRVEVLNTNNEQLEHQNNYLEERNAELITQTNQHAVILRRLVEGAGSRQNYSFGFGSLFSAGICAVAYYIFGRR
jgi:predicted nuclease with TOPRIM domain